MILTWLALAVLLVLIGAAVHVASAIGIVGLILGLFADRPLWHAIAEITWLPSTEFIFVAVPLFILLGEIFLRSGQTTYMYRAIAQWLNRLPGGLLHTNIVACALFGAPSGSSIATLVTVGTVALPSFRAHGYDQRMVLGSLAAGGTLGILLPPSINMIIYGVMTNTSIGQLYMAGWVPGILLTLLFMFVIWVRCRRRPGLAPVEPSVTWRARLIALPHVLPVLSILFVIMVSIQMGLATPTESAALGVLATLGMSLFYRGISFSMLWEASEATIRTTSMTMLIIMAAYFLNFVITYLGLPRAIVSAVLGLHVSPTLTMIGIIVLYLVLGCFLETISMMITTIPLIVPVVKALGYDPLWFGIILVILIEAALITPPIGLNLFVLQGMRRDGKIDDVIIGSLPFFLMIVVLLGLLMAFPSIVTWLPSRFYPA